jgi:hypothetical protein
LLRAGYLLPHSRWSVELGRKGISSNVAAYAAAGANVVVTSSPYLARPRDVQVRIGPA